MSSSSFFIYFLFELINFGENFRLLLFSGKRERERERMEQNTTASEGGGRGSSNTRSDFASSDARARSSALASSSSSSSNKSDLNAGNETKNNATTLTTTTETPRNTNHHQSKKTLPARTLLGLTVSGVCAGVFVGNFVLPFGYHQNTFASRSEEEEEEATRSLQRRVQRIIEEHRRVRASHGLVFPRVRTYEAILRANVTTGAKLRGDVRRRATGCLASSIVRVPTEVIKTSANWE